MKPRAAVFDLGKVLLDFDYVVVSKRLMARSKLGLREVLRLFSEQSHLLAFERGQMTRAQFYAEVCQASGYSGTLDEFAVEFGDIFTPVESMIRLQTEMRAGGTPTYVFSNTNELAVEHIQRAYPFYSNFDGYILSYEHGYMKPSPEIYTVVERVTGCAGAELFYLDDREENTAEAARRGWQAVTHRESDVSWRKAREAGLVS